MKSQNLGLKFLESGLTSTTATLNMKKYLQSCIDSKSSLTILVFHDDTPIGRSTCFAMEDADDEFSKALDLLKINKNETLYLAESVIKKEYRGNGIGSRFFNEREEFGIKNYNFDRDLKLQ